MIRQLRRPLLVIATSLMMMNQVQAQPIEFNEIINEASIAQMEAARDVRSALNIDYVITSPFAAMNLDEIQEEVFLVLKKLTKKITRAATDKFKKSKKKSRQVASI